MVIGPQIRSPAARSEQLPKMVDGLPVCPRTPITRILLSYNFYIQLFFPKYRMFKIEFSSKGKKEFDTFADERVEEAVKILAIDPVPAKKYDVKKLRGLEDTFRIRIGKARIVYTVIWRDKTIIISRVRKREHVYD